MIVKIKYLMKVSNIYLSIIVIYMTPIYLLLPLSIDPSNTFGACSHLLVHTDTYSYPSSSSCQRKERSIKNTNNKYCTLTLSPQIIDGYLVLASCTSSLIQRHKTLSQSIKTWRAGSFDMKLALWADRYKLVDNAISTKYDTVDEELMFRMINLKRENSDDLHWGDWYKNIDR